MNKITKKIAWQNPLSLAKKVIGDCYDHDLVLLYSGLNKFNKNSFSYLALFPKKKIISNNFFEVKKIIESSNERWFGYFSYELCNQFEKISQAKKSYIDLPEICLLNFELYFEFDHSKKDVIAHFSDYKYLDEVLKYKNKSNDNLGFKIKNFFSNFTNDIYLKKILDIKKMIENGDFFQMNLTRKFYGNFTKNNNQQQNFKLFENLVKSNPSNYSSFLKLDKNYVISSSPELFLKIDDNIVISRPIKGTIARGKNKTIDAKNKSILKNSVKDRAENLMIVDLVRNDFSRFCSPGSVKINNLFKIDGYKNIYHMSSEIIGKISKNYSGLDALQFCFPPGSMTGAPKVKAMQLISDIEKNKRGLYSGAIGYIEGGTKLNLSVVIRTLIIRGRKFEFQSGGAITHDSLPNKELKEMFDKSKSIIDLLKINF